MKEGGNNACVVACNVKIALYLAKRCEGSSDVPDILDANNAQEVLK